MNVKVNKLHLIIENDKGEYFRIQAYTPEIYPILENVKIDNEIKIFPQKLDIKFDRFVPGEKSVVRVSEIKKTGVYVFFCEACGEDHFVHTLSTKARNDKQIWFFNQDIHYPSFYPSLIWNNKDGKTCHFIIEDGWIKYHRTSQHKLAGKLLELKEVK